jgi:hypothetical protein
MRMLLLAAATVLLPHLAYADPLVQESAPSSIAVEKDGDNYRVTTVSRRYQTNILPSVTAKLATIYQLLEIEQRTTATEGPQTEQAFEEATVKVTSYPLSDKGKGPAMFTIEGRGDAVTAQNSFLTLTRYGCCVEMPTYAVYSLESGKYLFNATGEGTSGQWATMGAQGGFKFERIFAYHAKITAADNELFGDTANGAVIITYASDTEPLQRVMLIATQDDMDHDAPLEWMPKVDLINGTFPKGTDRIFIERQGVEKELFTDATMRLTLDEGTIVEIPVVADHLDIRAAKLPAGYSLVEMKL